MSRARNLSDITVITEDNGNIGINRTSPTYPLDIAGNVKIRHTDSNNHAILEGPANRTLYIDIDANDDNDSVIVRDKRDSSERLKVKANGDVGVGTSDPGYRFHAYHPTTNVVGKFESGDDEAWIAITDVSTDNYGTLLGRKSSDNTLLKVADEGVVTRFEVREDGYINATSASQVRLSLGSTGTAGTNTANWVRGNGGHLQFNSATDGFDWEVGGTNRMALSAAGELTMSNAPSFAASRTAGHVGNNTTVVWNSVIHNKGGHYNSGNGRFTAPVTGNYFIGVHCMVENNTQYSNKYYEVRVNNSTYKRAYSSNHQATHSIWPWFGVIALNAGDYVTVYSVNITIYATGAQYTHFSGHLLS